MNQVSLRIKTSGLMFVLFTALMPVGQHSVSHALSVDEKIEHGVEKINTTKSTRTEQGNKTGTKPAGKNQQSNSSQQPAQVKQQKNKRKKNRYCLGGSYKALANRSEKYDKIISRQSKRHAVSSALIKAVITAESCFNEKAVSPKGARGLMQLMPPTAKRFGVSNSFDPESNIRAGTKYLKFLLDYFDEDLQHAIAAYNAGEGTVKKYRGVPPYRETRNYVRKVAALYQLFKAGRGRLTPEMLRRSGLGDSVFVPQAMHRVRFSPYKNRNKNITRGNCANRTGSRLRKSTIVRSSRGVWQRIYVAEKGDTLMRVMQKTGVHKSKIALMNGLKSRSRLKPGEKLLVWECRK